MPKERRNGGRAFMSEGRDTSPVALRYASVALVVDFNDDAATPPPPPVEYS